MESRHLRYILTPIDTGDDDAKYECEAVSRHRSDRGHSALLVEMKSASAKLGFANGTRLLLIARYEGASFDDSSSWPVHVHVVRIPVEGDAGHLGTTITLDNSGVAFWAILYRV